MTPHRSALSVSRFALLFLTCNVNDAVETVLQAFVLVFQSFDFGFELVDLTFPPKKRTPRR